MQSVRLDRSHAFDRSVPRLLLLGDSLTTRSFPAWRAGIELLARETDVQVVPNSLEAITVAGVDDVIVDFSICKSEETATNFGRFAGRKILALDWTQPDAANQLARLEQANATLIASEFLPDEVPLGIEFLTDFYLERWIYLPPAAPTAELEIPFFPPDAQNRRCAFLGSQSELASTGAEKNPLRFSIEWPQLVALARQAIQSETLCVNEWRECVERFESLLHCGQWVFATVDPQLGMLLETIAEARSISYLNLSARPPSLLRHVLAGRNLPEQAHRPPAAKSLRELIVSILATWSTRDRAASEIRRHAARDALVSWSPAAFVSRVRKAAEAPSAPHAVSEMTGAVSGIDWRAASAARAELRSSRAADLARLLPATTAHAALQLLRCAPSRSLKSKSLHDLAALALLNYRPLSCAPEDLVHVVDRVVPMMRQSALDIALLTEAICSLLTDVLGAAESFSTSNLPDKRALAHASHSLIRETISSQSRDPQFDLEVRALAAAGLTSEAGHIAEEAYIRFPDACDLFARIGWTLSAEGAHENAVMYFERDHAARRLSRWWLHPYANVLARAGRDQAALTALADAYGQVPELNNCGSHIAFELTSSAPPERTAAYFAADLAAERISTDVLPFAAHQLAEAAKWDLVLSCAARFRHTFPHRALLTEIAERNLRTTVGFWRDLELPPFARTHLFQFRRLLEAEIADGQPTARAHFLLARACEAAGDDRAGAEHYRSGLYLSSEHGPERLGWLAFHFRRGAWSEISAELERRAALWKLGDIRRLAWSPIAEVWSELLVSRAIASPHRRTLACVAQWLKIELDAHRTVPETYINFAIALAFSSSPATALRWVEKHAERTDCGAAPFVVLAFLHWTKGDLDAARAALSLFSARGDHSDDDLALAAAVSVLLGEIVTGRDAYTALFVRNPSYFTSEKPIGRFNKWFVYALARRAIGDEQGAAEAMARASRGMSDRLNELRLHLFERTSQFSTFDRSISLPLFAIH